MDDMDGAKAPSMDFVAILAAVLRRWKLITTITLFAMIATYGVLRLVPSSYLSAVEILVYDPQQQINAEVQKPISPFVDAMGNDAMTTEIDILKSKSVALRVASELGLDKDPEFQPQSITAKLAEHLGLPGLVRYLEDSHETIDDAKEKKAESLDQAAEALLKKTNVWQEAYILFVTATAHSPILAQRLASTIATDYLNSQRDARQQALQRVASWLKDRVDNLQSRVLETEASIEKLKSENDLRDAEFNNQRVQQITELNNELMKLRTDVEEKHSRLEQVRHVIENNGDVQSIPELTASATITTLRQKQAELSSRATDLQNRLGEHHLQVIAIRAELATVTQQINSETEHVLGDMKNTYAIAVRQEQSLEANLQNLTAHANSEAYVKLQQLQRVAEADRKLYDSYLSRYQ